MAGKYGCPWTNIMCFQGCGCCKDCKEKIKYNCDSVCGIYKNNKNKPEIGEVEITK